MLLRQVHLVLWDTPHGTSPSTAVAHSALIACSVARRLLERSGSDGARDPLVTDAVCACLLLALGRWRPCEDVSGPLVLDPSTRDEPVHLSGSRLRTHQHWSPAGANCCQSLLLDPDATIGIDLHKGLFLLVTGRGELPQIFPYHGCALPTELGGRDGASALVVGLLMSLRQCRDVPRRASSSATRQYLGSGQQAPTRGGIVHGLHRGCPTLPGEMR